MHLSVRKRKDNHLDLKHGLARTIEHAAEALDCSRSSVYALARIRKLELVYLDDEKKKLPRITTRSIRGLVGEENIPPVPAIDRRLEEAGNK